MSDNSVDMLMAVARVLNRLPQPVVYTGGATISLYLDAGKYFSLGKRLTSRAFRSG